MNFQPTHASLPLWKEKSLEQKSQTLMTLWKDLNIYSEITGVTYALTVDKTRINDENSSSLYNAIQHGYRTVLAEPVSRIVANLNAAIPYDKEEEVNIQRTISFLHQNGNAINMNCELGHLTGSALVIHVESQKVLLHKHKKLGRFLQFGGHPDYELSLTEVAFREASEETGLTDLTIISPLGNPDVPFDVDPHVIPAKSDKPEHIHYDLRYLMATNSPGSIKALAGESDNFWWVELDEALDQPSEIIEHSIKRMILKTKKTLGL